MANNDMMHIPHAHISSQGVEQARLMRIGLPFGCRTSHVTFSCVSTRHFLPTNLQAIKEAEESKTKSYQAVCWLSRDVMQQDCETLSAVRELTVQQDTPVRVLHRRAARIRPRVVHSMSAAPVPGAPRYLVLDLTTQVGPG